jgi:hypothetical protein
MNITMRSARLILAAYVLVWFTMFVPSHTRGVVTVPGAKQDSLSATGSHSCCPSGKSDKPTKEQRKQCAVCFVASALSTPIVYVVQMRPIDCIGVASIHPDAQVLSNDFPAPYWPTGPPAAL